MNTNPEAKRILIYGDSLAWGLTPGSKKFERFPTDIRWPGKLQVYLGDGFEVIEECLCARTLDSDDIRPGFEGRNGMSTMVTCLDSQDPVDVVVVQLGLNEIKSIYDWTPEDVASKMKTMLNLIKTRNPNFHEVTPRIILLGSPKVDEGRAGNYWGELWVGSSNKSLGLITEFEKISLEMGVEFVDISKTIESGIDGVHLDEHSHAEIARILSARLQK